jgi:class 3 adenylate cyclase
VVSIIFADLVGSTSLHERLDAEAVRQFMEAYYAAMRRAVEAHGGRVTQVMGDGVKAVFGVPRVAEDDAIRAVRAGVAMQDAFRALAEEQRGRVGTTGLRVAVNTGEVVSDGETEIIGDPVNVAARLQERGRDGDVVIGGSTQRIVASLVTLDLLGSFALKGRAEEVEAYRVVSLEPPAGAATAAFVGRDEELARLRTVFETAVEKPASALTVLLGSPGLGKSRLIGEFVRRLGDDATVFDAHCDASGGATFAPLVAALRQRLGIEADADDDAVRATVDAVVRADDAERPRIVGGVTGLLSGTPASPEETFFVIRRLLAGLAAEKPVVLVIDDLQWAEPLLLDLVEHLVQWGSGVPLLVLIGARPELRELRSSLTVPGGFVADVVTLGGLDAGAAMRLAAGVIGASDLPAALAGKLLATSEGNPLFVSELVKMLVQEGVLQREGERWVASVALADLEMPPTIHALLAARIERIDADDRRVLECAAVVGRHFSRGAVAALLPDAERIDTRLEALRRSELIERDSGWLLGEPMLRFHHVLIRDAAYRRLLKGTRAELHAGLADWLEAQAGDDTTHDETIGRHLEQSHQHRRELGPLDAEGIALGERAARRLAAAGRRALEQDDVSLAGNLLGRAFACLPRDAPERPDLVLDWCEALLSAGDVTPAAEAIAELDRLCGDSERLRAWHTCFAGQLTTLTEPEGLRAAADAVAAAAKTLAAQDDAPGEAKAHFVHAQTLARLGRVGACEAALDQALAAARRVDDRRRANAVLAGAPRAALWGPSPVTRASGRCLDVVRVLRITQGAPAVEAVALSCQGVLEALRGRTDAAKRMIGSARKMVEELGIAHRVHETDVFAGRVALLEGDATAAERSLRGAYDGLRSLGLGIDAAQAAALLARALLAQGRAAEAEALSQESEVLAGDDLQAAIAWRGARAEAFAQRGEHAAAIELAQAAVEIAAATDALLDHADARMALAAALGVAGRAREAAAEERRAHELWETKGATLLVEQAKREASPDEAGARQPQQGAETERRVPPNPATRLLTEMNSAFAARDFVRLRSHFSDDHEQIDHPSGATLDAEESVESFERLCRSRDPYYQIEPIASLGPSLALAHRRSGAVGASGRRYDVGPYEHDAFQLAEMDDRGRLSRSEAFAADRLADAVTRLYERHAELQPEGPKRRRAEQTARSVAVFEAVVDPERVATALAADLEVDDRRSVGTGTLHGADALLQSLGALMDLSVGFGCRFDDVLAASEDALLVHMTSFGTHRESGGAYERPILELWRFDDDGRIGRWERFDPGHEAEALARFDALTAGGTEEPFANAASRAEDRFAGRFNAKDWAGIVACTAEGMVFDERRRLSRNTSNREVWLEQLRVMFDRPESRFSKRLLATRGERLCLHMHEFDARVADDAGPLAMEPHPAIHEVDEDGKIVAIVLFDAEDLDAAYLELDRRFEAGEGGALAEGFRLFCEALAGRDWDAILTQCAPDFVEHDHRSLAVLGTTRGAAAWVENFRALVGVAPDTTLRFEHLRASGHGFLWQLRWQGQSEASGYEIPMVGVTEFDTGGRIARIDFYDPEQLPEARARFEEIRTKADGASVFENAAARSNLQVSRSWAARNWEGVLAALSPALRFEDRRRMLRSEGGYDDFVAQYRLLFDQPESRWTEPLLATRGERLSLHRVLFEAEAPEGGGPLAFDEHLALIEVDAEGRQIGVVAFDLADEDAAWGELDRRFEAGEEGAAAEDLRLFRDAVANGSWDAVLARCAPDLTDHDHRRVAVFGTTRGAEAWVENFRALLRLAPDTTVRFEHVRVAPRGFLWQLRFKGTREGSDYEMPMVGTAALDAQGRLARVDTYDPEQLEQARARFAELDGPAAGATLLHNAAARAMAQGAEAIAARDWERFASLFSPDFRHFDRTKLAQVESGRDAFLVSYRRIVEMTSAPPRYEVLATRGERLVFARMLWQGAGGDVGPSEIEWHLIVEIDERGDHIAVVNSDPDDLDAAYAELDARYHEGEASPHPLAARWLSVFPDAIERRAWQEIDALSAPGQVARDNRLVSWGERRGAEEWLGAIQSMVELAPDMRPRIEHVRTSPHGVLWALTWLGTHEGGAFEIPVLAVVELDAEGLQKRIDLYDPGKLADAQARFAEIDGTPEESPFHNTASRGWDRVIAAWRRRDAEAFHGSHRDLLRYRDHRRLFQLDLDRERYREFTQPLLEMPSADASLDLVATRGDGLALMRNTIRMSDETVGASTIDSLVLIETSEMGSIRQYDRWDLDDLEAALAELDARYESSAPGAAAFLPQFHTALDRRDWDAVAACYAPDHVGQDHRLVSWGTLRGPAEFLKSLQQMLALASDARMRVDHVRATDRALLLHATWLGTRDGGAFESPFVAVTEIEPGLRGRSSDFYDPGQLDRALARFEEIRRRTEAGRHGTGGRPNAAAAALDRWWEGLDHGGRTDDWDLLRAACAPDLTFEDRQPFSQVAGGLELAIESIRTRVSQGANIDRTLKGTLGERIAVVQVLWTGGPADARFEVEYFPVVQTEESGLLSAIILCSDARSAQREAWARWAALEPERAAVAAPLGELVDAFNAHERALWRAQLAEDVVVDDHRHAGMGRLEGADAWADSLVALWELAPGSTVEAGWEWLALDEQAALTVVRRMGVLPEGGDFESEYLILYTVAAGKIDHVELYEVDARDEALARFEALRRPDPLRIPGNAAALLLGEIGRIAERDGMEALRPLVADGFHFEDHSRRSLVTGNVDDWLRSLEFLVGEAGGRPEIRLLATAGDRIALFRFAWRRVDDPGRYEIPGHAIVEADAAGRLLRFLLFDADAEAAAFAALNESWVASGDDVFDCIATFGQALNARDPARLRALLRDEFVYDDRRRTGAGRLEGADAYLPSAASWVELTRSSRIVRLCELARGPHGRVFLNRLFGEDHEGGAFEIYWVSVTLVTDGKIARIELFEPEDRAAAIARFEELRPDPLRVPPNAAARALEEVARLRVENAVDRLSALVTEDFEYEDRGRRSLVRGGIEEWVRSIEYLAVETRGRPERRLVATAGDRLALHLIEWRDADDSSRYEMGGYRITEVDAEGRIRAFLLFDAEDKAGAHAEMFERWTRQEDGAPVALAEYVRHWNANDLAGARAFLTDDFVFHDHRRTGIGRVDLDGHIEAVQALHALSSEIQLAPLYLIGSAPHGTLSATHWWGTSAEGGDFESVFVSITQIAGDRLRAMELFELDDLDAARARFEELGRETTAVRSLQSMLDTWPSGALATNDFAIIREAAHPDFRYEDRGRRALVEGDVETWIESMRFWPPGTRVGGEVIGTFGDRIALDRATWAGDRDGEAFEIERVRLTEFDGKERLLAAIHFDPEDGVAATLEALQRFGRGEGAGCESVPVLAAIYPALHACDWEALRAAFRPDLVFVDHRPLRLGTLDAEGLIASWQAAEELGPHSISAIHEILAWSPNALLLRGDRQGNVRDGGPYEVAYVGLFVARAGRLSRYEVFDETGIEEARARFEALSTGEE